MKGGGRPSIRLTRALNDFGDHAKRTTKHIHKQKLEKMKHGNLMYEVYKEEK